MGISFGPGGNSISFGKRRFPEELPLYLESFGLNGYEFECGRGVRISEKSYRMIPALTKDISFSLHAPYFISLSSTSEETRLKSIVYILESAKAAQKLGIRKIVVHSGSCGKISRDAALDLARDTLMKAREALIENNLSDIIICPETMGKVNQLGNLSEVISLCKSDESFLPCIDFGHLNARTKGGIKTAADYEDIICAVENGLGYDRLKNMHIHFSKIMYTEGGEKTHLTFEDSRYGPEFEPLLEIIYKKSLSPSIICESQGTQAEDAASMKRYYSSLK